MLDHDFLEQYLYNHTKTNAHVSCSKFDSQMVKDAFYVQKWWWPTKIRRPRAQTTPWALSTTAKPADVYLAYPQTTLESQITPSLKNKGMD